MPTATLEVTSSQSCHFSTDSDDRNAILCAFRTDVATEQNKSIVPTNGHLTTEKSVETSATLNLTALTTITDEKKPKNASFWHVRSAVDPELFAFIFVKKKQKYFFVTGNHYLAVNCFLSALQTISSFFFSTQKV